MPSKEAGSVKGKADISGAKDLAGRVKLAIDKAEERGREEERQNRQALMTLREAGHRAEVYRAAAQAVAELVLDVTDSASRTSAAATFQAAAVERLEARAAYLEVGDPPRICYVCHEPITAEQEYECPDVDEKRAYHSLSCSHPSRYLPLLDPHAKDPETGDGLPLGDCVARRFGVSSGPTFDRIVAAVQEEMESLMPSAAELEEERRRREAEPLALRPEGAAYWLAQEVSRLESFRLRTDPEAMRGEDEERHEHMIEICTTGEEAETIAEIPTGAETEEAAMKATIPRAIADELVRRWNQGRNIDRPGIVRIDVSEIQEGDSVKGESETWYFTKRRPKGGGFHPERLRSEGAPDVPMSPTIVEAQESVAWMSARADDIWGDTQKQEWARQIVTLDRFLFRLFTSEDEPRPWTLVGDKTPWPLGYVVDHLLGAVRHLFDGHDCDHAGHESWKVALSWGLRYFDNAEEEAKRQADLEEPKGSSLPEDARQLALTARALGIRSNPDREHVLPNEDRESLVKHADAVLDALRGERPQGFRLSVDALATAHDIARVADHYDKGEHGPEAIVPVCLSDLRTLRAMLPAAPRPTGPHLESSGLSAALLTSEGAEPVDEPGYRRQPIEKGEEPPPERKKATLVIKADPPRGKPSGDLESSALSCEHGPEPRPGGELFRVVGVEPDGLKIVTEEGGKPLEIISHQPEQTRGEIAGPLDVPLPEEARLNVKMPRARKAVEAIKRMLPRRAVSPATLLPGDALATVAETIAWDVLMPKGLDERLLDAVKKFWAATKIPLDHGPCLACGRTIGASEGLFIREGGNEHSPRCPSSLGFCTSCDQEKFEGVEHVHDYEAQRRSGGKPEPVAPRLCEQRGWCDLPFEHEGRCAPAGSQAPVECRACRGWHKPPACKTEGAKK